MTEEEYIKELRVCPFNDVNCPYYDWRFNMCDRLATMEPKMFLLNYCIQCEEE
jgi:hypothetical protein